MKASAVLLLVCIGASLLLKGALINGALGALEWQPIVAGSVFMAAGIALALQRVRSLGW